MTEKKDITIKVTKDNSGTSSTEKVALVEAGVLPREVMAKVTLVQLRMS
jgi:hypothetical protein